MLSPVKEFGKNKVIVLIKFCKMYDMYDIKNSLPVVNFQMDFSWISRKVAHSFNYYLEAVNTWNNWNSHCGGGEAARGPNRYTEKKITN